MPATWGLGMSARPALVGPGRRNGESDAQFAGIFVFEQSSEIRYSGVDMAIEEIVSAAEANRSFSRLLRGVREGRRDRAWQAGRAARAGRRGGRD